MKTGAVCNHNRVQLKMAQHIKCDCAELPVYSTLMDKTLLNKRTKFATEIFRH